ncbi:MAG: aldolase/citrate lyase family protein [Pseudomonadota bacterium]
MNRLQRNAMLSRLETGEPQYGLWLGIPDASVAEICGMAGFDWLVVDHEHGPFELRDVMHHLRALAPHDVAPIVRPVDGSPALLKKLCDIGVQSFVVPMVDTPDQAAELVRAVKYPPDGIRGMGTSMARAAGWNTVPGYLHDANREMCVVVQAETVQSLENLPAIAATDGIDGVFFGPSDLSASMGHVGGVSHPEVIRAIKDGIATVRAAGKYAGLLCLDPAEIGDYVAAGASFVGVGVDTLLIGNAARALAAQCRGTDEDDSPAGY